MKVVHLTNHTLPCKGGMEEMIYKLNQYLLEEEVETKIVCLNKCSKSNNELPVQENVDGVHIFRMKFDKKLFGYYLVPRNQESVTELISDADIVHVHGLNWWTEFAIKNRLLHNTKSKIVLSTHGGIFHTKINLLKWLYLKLKLKGILEKVDLVIASSSNDSKIFSEYMDTKKLITIENGVDFAHLPSIEDKNEKLEKNSFLFLGRFSENKQIELLIKAFSESIFQSHKKYKLYIAGGEVDHQSTKMQNLARMLNLDEDKIEFHVNASQKKVNELLEKCEFIVSASRFEGFGISIIEGMHCQCIPIVNRIEAFEKNVPPTTGFLADYSDTKNTAKLFVNCTNLNEEQKELLRKNGKSFTQQFDWKEKVKEFVLAYKKVMQ